MTGKDAAHVLHIEVPLEQRLGQIAERREHRDDEREADGAGEACEHRHEQRRHDDR